MDFLVITPVLLVTKGSEVLTSSSHASRPSENKAYGRLDTRRTARDNSPVVLGDVGWFPDSQGDAGVNWPDAADTMIPEGLQCQLS